MIFRGIQTRQNGPEKASVVVVLNVDNRLLISDARWRGDVRQPGQGTILRNDQAEGGHGVQYEVASASIEIMDRQIEVGHQLVEIKVVTAGDVLGMTREMRRYVLGTRFRLSREGGVRACEDANRSKTQQGKYSF